MNFFKYRDQIEELLFKGYRYSQGKSRPNYNPKTYHRGVYVWASTLEDDRMKVGVAYGNGGLYQRLNQYRICFGYNDKFFLNYLLISKSESKARKLERILLSNLKTAPNQFSSQEWKINDKDQQIGDILIKVINNHLDLWDAFIVFYDIGYIMVSNKGNKQTHDIEKSKDLLTVSKFLNLSPEIFTATAVKPVLATIVDEEPAKAIILNKKQVSKKPKKKIVLDLRRKSQLTNKPN